MNSRIAVTGMAINTPLADTLGGHLEALFAERSAIGLWKVFEGDPTASRIGGDLTAYDAARKLASLELEHRIPPPSLAKARRFLSRAPWSVGLSVLLALDAWSNAGLFSIDLDADQVGLVVGGHNLHGRYHQTNFSAYARDPDSIDALYALHLYDTTHLGCVSDLLRIRGCGTMVSAACATGLHALRAGIDEIRFHRAPVVLVVAPVWDFASVDMHAMALIDAIATDFDHAPQRASRPFDVDRCGFVPAHGGAAMVLENFDHALERGARVFCELLSVGLSCDASYLPQPSQQGQALAMQRALSEANLRPEALDYINGHFTSTRAGDLSEANAIKDVFGRHAHGLKLNATKSMLGHTLGASGLVELVGAIAQMNAGRLHRSINVEKQDPAIDLEVCAGSAVECSVRYLMKNAFGFGGLNASAIVANVNLD